MTLLVVGGDSFLGNALASHFLTLGRDVVVTTRRRDTLAPKRIFLDLAHADDVPLEDIRPATVLLCAGITRFQACEDAPALADKVNVEGIVRVARRTYENAARIVLLSTNAVFDGTGDLPHETSRVCPSTRYGLTKAMAETAVLGMGDHVSVLRLTKVVSGKLPLIARWHELLQDGSPIEPYRDVRFSPITVHAVAQAVSRIIDGNRSGIFHLSGDGTTTYADFAALLAADLGFPGSLVRPVDSDATGRPVPFNPVHAALDMETTMQRLMLAPQPVADVARIVARELHLAGRRTSGQHAS